MCNRFGKFEEALGHFQHCQRIMPYRFESNFNMGLALHRFNHFCVCLIFLGVMFAVSNKKYEEAYLQFDEILQWLPLHVDTYLAMGGSLSALGMEEVQSLEKCPIMATDISSIGCAAGVCISYIHTPCRSVKLCALRYSSWQAW